MQFFKPFLISFFTLWNFFVGRKSESSFKMSFSTQVYRIDILIVNLFQASRYWARLTYRFTCFKSCFTLSNSSVYDSHFGSLSVSPSSNFYTSHSLSTLDIFFSSGQNHWILLLINRLLCDCFVIWNNILFSLKLNHFYTKLMQDRSVRDCQYVCVYIYICVWEWEREQW